MPSGVDAVVVYLAALSNEPLSHAFEEATLDINYRACIALWQKTKRTGDLDPLKTVSRRIGIS